MLPGLRPVQVGLLCIPCARVPFLHRLRSLCIARGLCSSVVRRLRQYYGLVRLPSGVHGGCDPSLVVRPFHFLMSGNLWDLPVLAIGVSVHAQGLRLRRTGRRLANCVLARVAFPHKPQGLPTKVVISACLPLADFLAQYPTSNLHPFFHVLEHPISRQLVTVLVRQNQPHKFTS